MADNTRLIFSTVICLHHPRTLHWQLNDGRWKASVVNTPSSPPHTAVRRGLFVLSNDAWLEGGSLQGKTNEVGLC